MVFHQEDRNAEKELQQQPGARAICLVARKALPGAVAVEALQKRSEHVEALRLQYPAVLAFRACTALQRLRKVEDSGNQIAIELTALGRAESGTQ